MGRIGSQLAIPPERIGIIGSKLSILLGRIGHREGIFNRKMCRWENEITVLATNGNKGPIEFLLLMGCGMEVELFSPKVKPVKRRKMYNVRCVMYDVGGEATSATDL